MFPKYARIVGCLVSSTHYLWSLGFSWHFFLSITTPRQSLRFHQHLRAWHGGRHRKTCLVDDTAKVSENRMEVVIWRELLHFVPQTHTLVSSFVQWFSSLCSLDVSTRSLGTSPDALWRWLRSQIHKLVILSDSHTYDTNVAKVHWNFYVKYGSLSINLRYNLCTLTARNMPFVSFCSFHLLSVLSAFSLTSASNTPLPLLERLKLAMDFRTPALKTCIGCVCLPLQIISAHENWDILDILNWCRISFMNISWTVATFSDAGISPQRGSNGTSSVERSKATKEKLRRTKSWAAIFLDQFVGFLRCHRNWLHVMRYIQSLSLV